MLARIQPIALILITLLGFSSFTNPASAAERIVSAGGGLTETLYALKQEQKLVGVDTTSYYPKAATQLPQIGYLRALSAEGILSLKPDTLIVTSEAGPPPVLHQIERTGVNLIRLKATHSFAAVVENIKQIATALDCVEEGNRLIEKLSKQHRKLIEYTQDNTNKPKVMFVLQHVQGTPMVAGRDTAAAGIIELAGAENASNGFSGYKPLSPEALIAAAPDVILLSTRPDSTPKQLQQRMDNLSKLPGFALTPAIRNKRIISMDALTLLGFGPRTVGTASQLAERLATLFDKQLAMDLSAN